MDFFGDQERARRQTWRLVFLYLLAVVAIVAVLVVVAAVLYRFALDRPPAGGVLTTAPRWLLVAVAAVALATIVGGTLYRTIELSGGGRAVAEMVGARLVERDTSDPAERRLLNIVEEMALASGIAVPPVYVMDEEDTINAFAAGYSPNEAVIAVTSGILEHLNRDELQGVIGHEFSHILNGDMRLNVRLLGVLSGIEAIGSFGLFLVRAGGRAMREDVRAGSLMIPGAAIATVGYIGVFFARLIKAGVSRQREFLADASAVQFTRNPDGIGGALAKIATRGSGVGNRYAQELAHMFIGQALRMADWFATHPPIDDRIERVLGRQAVVAMKWRARKAAASATSVEPAGAEAGVSAASFAGAAGAAGFAGVAGLTSDAVVATVGRPTAEHVTRARRLLDELPQGVREGLGAVDGARAALFALVVGTGDTRASQRRILAEAYDPAFADRTAAMADALAPTVAQVRLPIVDLAAPTLQALAQPAREMLLVTLERLVRADERVSVGEFVILALCRRHFGAPVRRAPPVKHHSLDALPRETATVLSLLVHAGGGEETPFVRAMTALGLPGQRLVPREALTIGAVERGLYELKLLAPLKKPALVKACVELVLADGKIAPVEAELVRAICATIDSPLPPILEPGAAS